MPISPMSKWNGTSGIVLSAELRSRGRSCLELLHSGNRLQRSMRMGMDQPSMRGREVSERGKLK